MRTAPFRSVTVVLAMVLAPLALTEPTGGAEAAEAESLSLTVYSAAEPAEFDPQRFIAQQQGGRSPRNVQQVPGFGVVRSLREINLDAGEQTLQLTDVAQFIDPTTVSFTDLGEHEPASVLEQQFEFDLVSPQKLLERYIDREITLLVPAAGEERERVTGTLLSIAGSQLILQTDEGVRMIRHTGDVQVLLEELAEGLVTRPTLSWLLNVPETGEREVRTSYQTDGITWRADYNMILHDDEASADISAWVTLLNLSGASYPDAELKLIAGDVQRVQPDRVRRQAQLLHARQAAAQADQAFEQEAFFEYHLYTLPRRTDVPENATKQLTLFPTAQDVDVEKVLIYQGAQMPRRYWPRRLNEPRTEQGFATDDNQQVDVFIRFENAEENNMGMPLPRGKFRVFQENPNDGSLEFVGEDLIDHTPRDEELMIKVGKSFDLVGERTQTDFTLDTSRRVMTESFRVQLRNHQDDDVRVTVKEPMYRWRQWEISDTTHEFEKIDARTVHFDLEVPARGERTVEYTVRYTW